MSLRKALSFAALCAVAVIVCGFDAEGKAGVKRAGFGRTADGRDVDIYTLTNRRGAEARVITYGGALLSPTGPHPRGPPPDSRLRSHDIPAYPPQNLHHRPPLSRHR